MERMEKAVLVGNGINFSAGAWGWPKVIARLNKSAGLVVDPEDGANIPLPLLADRALHRGDSAYDELFGKFKAHLDELEPTKVHHRLVRGDCGEVLTTNYDLALEKAAGEATESLSNAGWAQESKYSQFRHFECEKGLRIWHVHGDVTAKNSLLLGYERYAGYLHVLRQTVTEGRKYRKTQVGPWRHLVGVNPPQTWPTMLFTHRVLILGLGMDFAEAHLWWLLAYRAGKRRRKGSKTFPKNEILFVWNTAGDSSPIHRARARQLRSFGVEVVEENWEGDDWSPGYCDVLDRFAENRL